MVLEGSHRNHRLLNGYAQRDVDEYCINKPERGIEVQNYGWLAQDPPRVRRGLGGRWLSHEFGAGDVVVFSTVLVHGGLDNRSRRIRLSTDSRYQLASEPVDHRWVGPDPPGHGPRGKRGKIC
jgi:pimeloyl-ACP methyl ester carboxylesterase